MPHRTLKLLYLVQNTAPESFDLLSRKISEESESLRFQLKSQKSRKLQHLRLHLMVNVAHTVVNQVPYTFYPRLVNGSNIQFIDSDGFFDPSSLGV